MKDRIAALKWVDIAVGGIHFPPDRERVKAELLEHVEDKTADLMRVFPDMTEKEAQERALAGMGDAWELKAALAKVHRPWLGYIWMSSWVVVAAVLVLCVIGLHSSWWKLQAARQERQIYEQTCQALYGDNLEGWQGERLALYAPGAEGRLGRATVSVPRAARWRLGDWNDGKACLYLQVRITWDYPWEAARNAGPFWRFQVNGGEEYSRAFGAGGWNWREMNLWLYGDEVELADQVILTYLPGTDFCLTVDLSQEVEP